MFRFAYPLVMLALALIPLVVVAAVRWRRRRAIGFSSVALVVDAGLQAPLWKRFGLIVIRSAVVALIIAAVARPQTGQSEVRTHTEGVDIILVVDASGSMQAEDFRPKNRLHVAREVVKEFIAGRTSDRIGLVAFAAQAVTQCPLTLDYPLLTRLVDEVDIGMLEDGTAIGVALATACNRLKNSEAQSRVVILLTDGQNNAGSVDPTTAARVAASLGIKVYTVGVGTRGRAPIPVDDPVFGRRMVSVQVDLDEETLTKIAQITDGLYFRATNREELSKVYSAIDAMERTELESETYTQYTERFAWFLLPAIGLLVLELALGQTLLREVP